jgi:hypothetical protein
MPSYVPDYGDVVFSSGVLNAAAIADGYLSSPPYVTFHGTGWIVGSGPSFAVPCPPGTIPPLDIEYQGSSQLTCTSSDTAGCVFSPVETYKVPPGWPPPYWPPNCNTPTLTAWAADTLTITANK